MPNPYLAVHARIRQKQPLSLAPLLMPLLAAALAAPLARSVLLAFIDTGAVAVGVGAVGFRVGAVMVATMALHTYADLVRGADRPVLDPHPVLARALLVALMVRTARERLYLPLVAMILMAPLAVAGEWVAWGAVAALAVGGWICGLGVGYAVNLGGVWAAQSPGLAKFMDLLRGDNPRTQAAFIYAPAAALAVGGVAVGFASGGAQAALEGYAAGWLWLLIPPAVGLMGIALSLPLADRYYVLATALLAEIEGMWATVENKEDARHVYLEWAARDPETLRALRQGWRRCRSWATGAWLLGAGGLFAGWSAAEDAPRRVVLVAGAAAVLIAALPTRLAEGDPEWLDLALGVKPRRVALARAMTGWLYLQGTLILPVFALLIRHGLWSALGSLALVELLGAVGVLLSAAMAARWGGAAIWSYGPVALVLWAVVAAGGGL